MNIPRSVAVLLAVVIMLSGCATPSNPKVTQACHEFKTRKTYAQGIGGGILIGAIVGGLSGIEVNGGQICYNRDRGIRNALIFAGAGGIEGGLHAHDVVEQRRAYAAQAQILENAIKQTHSTTEAAGSFNRTFAKEVSHMKQGDAALAGTLRDARSVLSAIQSDINCGKDRLQKSGSAAGEAQRELSREIVKLESEKTQLMVLIEKVDRKRDYGRIVTER